MIRFVFQGHINTQFCVVCDCMLEGCFFMQLCKERVEPDFRVSVMDFLVIAEHKYVTIT